jgi:hypothetical protein
MDNYFYPINVGVYAAVLVLCGWYALQCRKIRSGRVRVVTANVVLFLFMVSTAYMAGETYYRFVYDLSDSMNITLTSLKWYKKHFSYNNLGIRDNIDYALQAPDGKPRISFAGDSFTAGAGINDVGGRFVNLIRKESGWDVHSLAFCGGDTLSETKAIEDLFAHGYRTDYVVLVYNLNDATDLSSAGPGKMRRIISQYESGNIFRNRSYFVDTMYYRYKRQHDPQVRNHFLMLPDDYRGDTWEKLTSALLRLNRLVSDRGARLLVVTFPLVHAINAGDAYPYQAIHNQMNDFLEMSSIPHMDLLEPLLKYRDKALTANKYDGHPNELAHRVAAGQIRDFIEQQMGLPHRRPAGGGR